MKRLFLLAFGVIILFISCKKNITNVELKNAPSGGNFTLLSKSGKVSLSDFKGNVVIMYFGFMSCPDICPTTLSVVANALKKLTKSNRSEIRMLFIDVDPERDSLEKLQDYVVFFNPGIIALTGDIPELKKVSELYGASFHKQVLDSSMGYTIDHTTSLFLIDQEGNFRKTLPHGVTSNEIVTAIEELLIKKK